MWQEVYRQNPWDFAGMDKLLSHALFHIVGSNAALKPGIGMNHFRYPDAYRDGQLSEVEFSSLSLEERSHYATYATLTQLQFELLDETGQQAYVQRLVQNAKTILSH
ncbi:hypothetical protein TDB9533_01230 [Thalassocella blandensis]|nr:hypothetical protein TDB9533_01230 [Thalassocella blandensis]